MLRDLLQNHTVFKIFIFFAVLAIIFLAFLIRSFILTRAQNSGTEEVENNEIPDVEKDTGFDFGLGTRVADSQPQRSTSNTCTTRYSRNEAPAFLSRDITIDEAYISETFTDGRPKTAIFKRRSNGEIASARVIRCEKGELVLSFHGPKSPTFTRRLVSVTHI